MIEVKGICKSYGNKKIVDDVSFNIEKGKITSFIGPNGAGKSTVLSMLSRITSIDSGEVYIDGKEISKWDTVELSKKISILKQSNNINVRLTIKELVSFGRFPYSKGKLTNEDKKFINKAIKYMELSDIENKYLDELSGGQRQRAYIAMIIAQNTDYILLDEPLNNLDMKHSVQMMKVLKGLTEDLKKTVVIVIHDINFASCYSDNIIVLNNGKLVKDGLKEEIINKQLLEDIYKIDFNIKDIDGNKICVYF
ncbi:iron ABC transporter ATP-binding protein [Clostridium senegalense]|uniref:ATP-binding cassette domain-containing protein n=1 Tax=Clostridium senegalense TaxID=1465809 RepID=A0A6M0H4P4_9CLOT|nr:ATP-binding cassette domain-containing protein [Clostridium senegalense]NEU05053.1 ATP-binding cassette domain-containing protein [Clostridium senegalense]